MMQNTNKQEQYESYVEQMTAKGIPVSTAKDAALVMINDKPGEPKLGRTEEDQRKILDAYTWYKAKKENN